jgi:hypothetical protein
MFSLRPLQSALMIMALGVSSLAKAEPYVLQHSWYDYAGQPHQLGVVLSEARVSQALTEGRDLYDYKSIFRVIINNAKSMANDMATPTAKVQVDRDGMGYRISSAFLTGHEEEAKAQGLKIQNFIEGAYDDLQTATYYRQDKTSHTLVINYSDIVSDFQDVFAQVDAYFQQSDRGKNALERINDRLAFLQSIPYDDMTHSDFDLNTPIRMLAERRGDCESKQVFMAGLLRRLFPDRVVQLVTLPDRAHILLALEMPELPTSWTFPKDGRRYLIMDATGPGVSPVENSANLRISFDFDYGNKLWYPIN